VAIRKIYCLPWKRKKQKGKSKKAAGLDVAQYMMGSWYEGGTFIYLSPQPIKL